MHKDILLGKETEYKSEYDASLLFPIEREKNRQKLNQPEQKVNGDLPFFGVDVWTGFEISWLNPSGKPQVVIAEFRIPETSKNIIESKSFKLYLNSFNNTKLSDAETVRLMMEKDLSAAAGGEVAVSFFDVMEYPLDQSGLGVNIDHLDVVTNQYTPDSSLLLTESENTSEILHSHLLKSNCPVTNQPDWATVIIQYKGPKLNHEALLKYIISYREHDDFHEHCVEQIFCDISKLAAYEELTVTARYTRRGGLDINPTRSLKSIDGSALIGRLARQ
jgi:7-cyano-7-deazaguanine reductase